MTNIVHAPSGAPASAPYAPAGTLAEEEIDTSDTTRLSRPAARWAALLRIALGLVYLWAFASQGFGIDYSNRPPAPPQQAAGGGAPAGPPAQARPDGKWHFAFDTKEGFITSGLATSPTSGYLKANSRGPLAFIPQNLPAKANDVLWMFGLGGLGIALTLGIFSKAAAWGGLALNLLMWFSSFPPENNPVLDGEHMIFGLVLVTLMYVRAGDTWGLGRWWRAHTPSLLH